MEKKGGKEDAGILVTAPHDDPDQLNMPGENAVIPAHRPSIASFASSEGASEKQWMTLKKLVEKAHELGVITPKQTEIIESSIIRREKIVLTVLHNSGGDFSKVHLSGHFIHNLVYLSHVP